MDEPVQKRPRQRTTGRGLLGVAAALLLLGAAWTWTRYAPLEPGNSGAAPPDSVPTPGPGLAGDERALYVTHYSEDAPIPFAFSVRNTGPLTVRIEGIALGQCAMICQTGLRLQKRRNVYSTRTEDSVPFAPFDLQPGEDRFVIVDAKMTDCRAYGPSTGGTAFFTTLDQEVVRYSVFGLLREQDVSLRQVVEVTSPPAGACPE